MNDLEKWTYINELYDVYGSLLSQGAKDIFELYYYDNLSLQEIADQNNVSKSAIFDRLKRVENQLIKYERNLRVLKLKKQLIALNDSKVNKLLESHDDEEGGDND